jgi:membrane associated rhomboid family serine protease
LELIPIPAIIIISILIALWRKAYFSQMFVIANVIIFIYQFGLSRVDLTGGLYNIVHDTQTFVPARFGQIEYLPSIFTSMFMHAGVLHLIGNVLILYLLGLPLEERIGTKNFGIIYFITGIAATLSFYLFSLSYKNSVGLLMFSNAHLLGASGAIFGIGGALLILYPKDRIPMILGFFFTTRAPVWLAVGLMFAVESVLVFYSNMSNVAHIAHIGGIVCGIVIAPLIVRERAIKSKIDFEVLRSMALTKEDALIVDKIERETEKDVQEAWLDFFFTEVSRCPKCRRHVDRADTIKCECGEVIELMK